MQVFLFAAGGYKRSDKSEFSDKSAMPLMAVRKIHTV
jgi:hypothetical protein